jgi:alpha-galactosidase/6-phospho-beta-glucosidase family protein
VDIVIDNLSWDEACEKEKEFIAIYKRNCDGGILCNLTIGGEGAFGRILSEETKSKISKKVSGINHGMYGKSHSEAAKNKIIETASKKVINIETNQIFTSIKNAAISMNIRPNTLTRKLSGIRKNDTVFKLI